MKLWINVSWIKPLILNAFVLGRTNCRIHWKQLKIYDSSDNFQRLLINSLMIFAGDVEIYRSSILQDMSTQLIVYQDRKRNSGSVTDFRATSHQMWGINQLYILLVYCIFDPYKRILDLKPRARLREALPIMEVD